MVNGLRNVVDGFCFRVEPTLLLVGYTDAISILLTRTGVVTWISRTTPADTTLTCFSV